MKVTKQIIQACCGKMHVVFKLDRPIDLALLQWLKNNGFNEFPRFTQAGMLYADNLDLTVSGPFGADKLNVRCKKTDCEQILNNFEELLSKMG